MFFRTCPHYWSIDDISHEYAIDLYTYLIKNLHNMVDIPRYLEKKIKPE